MERREGGLENQTTEFAAQSLSSTLILCSSRKSVAAATGRKQPRDVEGIRRGKGGERSEAAARVAMRRKKGLFVQALSAIGGSA